MDKTKRIALQGIVLTMNEIEEQIREGIGLHDEELTRILVKLAEAYSIIERGKRYDPNT